MKKYTLLISIFALLFSCSTSEKGSFELGDKNFLLNGETFVIKAAELHYPRIPKEYWEHRIQAAKALGMNTICLYVFWNYHEPEEGKYDFSGQKDIVAFCRMAQKHDMYVIVRPGPYVCAEWEMGGLPWWLLKKKDIKLREQDPYYMERTKLFMNEVGKQLADLQISKGGNIIMVQVENEYGAFGIDKPYIAEIRDIVKGAGFTDVPLFQCDWNSNFENNALEDLVWTINFGTGANIDDQFKRLQELRPNTPLMCSEFWSGWFDHWGAKHETRSAEDLVNGMKEMLDRNISFSLYMTHGGTSFGHWGGANFPNFSPTCTSYDYDAPIGESGNITPKYYEVRNLLKNYLPEGQTLAEIPDSIPTIAIPAFELTEIAPLFDNLPEAKESETVKSMEFFDQGWGSILYRTKLEASTEEQTLIITEAHDWAQVFIDGKKIATLSRLKGEGIVKLPPIKDGTQLDILVEAMGRMNFGKGIYDWKGITEKVELESKSGTKELRDWQVYNIPVDYEFAKNKEYRKEPNTARHPAYYRGTFTLDKVGDTFFNMMSWSKGMVWVNGYPIGRFWEIGPQQTLYMPGCWLKEGENEIIILDMASPSKPETEGLRKPILDIQRGNGAYAHRKLGENLDLTRETPVYQGTFKPGNGWQHIQFGKTTDTRFFCLEALSSYGGDDYAAIAELELLGEDGKPVSRQHWKVVYADSEELNVATNAATNVFDLQESTFWHTNYSTAKPKYPHQLVIDLGEDKKITGFSYLPRAEANKPGMIRDFSVYIKMNPFELK
ncbi:beta-galactosidase [Dysgonomonas sp. PFB1-18]|uniref:beta-galactosidase n=1 Tax=unclassified Dysgonomonas TaxID=2630389 RepID=UPI00247431B8|nr:MULTISPECIES: beta-galactosidase [unclassified Dysgonomonas]MDH6310538.1 beta-galactosidase [Dysgonomonas sp. PF1-14]MDH6340388.1 beta-galactosidase [Dysgonomonas sp. PF1-16]MDH6382032.1 beta-galactosidase [Dysgonomonas sp. PFB1-18]MDH6399359.1 beta-galactosidase [Dysgonomonas sp. PF1-23]